MKKISILNDMRLFALVVFVGALLLSGNIYSQQNLVVGFTDPYEDTLLSGVTAQYDTLFVLNNGSVTIENADITINYTAVVTDSATLVVEHSYFTVNGSLLSYGNAQVDLKDTLVLNCSLISGGNSSLNIDSAFAFSHLAYMGQYEILGFDSGSISITNTEYEITGAKYGGGLSDNCTFYQNNSIYNSAIGLAMTIGVQGNTQFTVEDCICGMELIINDSCDINITNTDTLILWFGFVDGDTANINFPVTEISYPPHSNIASYTFSDALPNVNGVDYTVNLTNCNTVYWTSLIQEGSDITFNDDILLAVGLFYNGTVEDTLEGLVNNQFYASYNPGFSDRNLLLNNSMVLAWNFYPSDSSHVVVKDCVFGEILTFYNSSAEIINSTCDGMGGYFGSSETSYLYAYNTIIKRMYTTTDIILNKDNSLMVLEESEVIGNVNLNQNAKLIHINTTHNDNMITSGSSYFMNIALDSITNAHVDSLVNITGSLYDQKAILNFDQITGFRLDYSLSDSTNMNTIVDTSYTPFIISGLIYEWNTNGILSEHYIIWLTVYLNGDSIATATQDFLLQDPLSIQENETAGDMMIYPNPTTGLLTIEEKNMNSVTITDLTGKVIYEKEVNTNSLELDLSGYSKAVYFIKVRSAEGIQVEKVILK